MPMNNKVQLIGHLGADPEVRRLNNGDMVVNLRLATTDKWRDKQSGERKERTEWHNVVIFNDALGKIAEQYLKKGSQVAIEGKLQTRTYEKDGEKRYMTEVVLQNFAGELFLLGSKDDGDRDRGGGRRDDRDDRRDYGRESGRSSRGDDRDRGRGRDLPDDEIPF